MMFLRKQGLWLIVAMLVGIVGVLLIYHAKSVNYTSTSQVDVEARVVPQTQPAAVNMGTEAQVATSGVVVTGTARALGLPQSQLTSALSAKVSGTANILSISCTMPTPDVAQRCAEAAAATYTAFRNDVTADRNTRQHDPLQVTLVTVASTPNAPAGPGKKILLPIGAILGLMLGLGGVVVREHFDTRVRDRADLETSLKAPVLAEVPRIRRGSVNPAFVFSERPLSPAAEAYRYLRAHLAPLIADTPGGAAVILVSGARPREGRTSVAANLAAALAHTGETVLLVDADMRNPALDELFDTGERAGLTDLLAARASLEEVAVATDVAGLRLVTAGTIPAGADTLDPARLSRVMARMRASANVIVVDSAPVLAVSDAVTLARVSDLVLLVADVRRTGRQQAADASQQIQGAGTQIVIGVLNCVPRPFPSILTSRTRNFTAEPATIAPARQAATILARPVPPRGLNGKGRAAAAEAGQAAPPQQQNGKGRAAAAEAGQAAQQQKSWSPAAEAAKAAPPQQQNGKGRAAAAEAGKAAPPQRQNGKGRAAATEAGQAAQQQKSWSPAAEAAKAAPPQQQNGKGRAPAAEADQAARYRLPGAAADPSRPSRRRPDSE